jgi:RNA polymerase sigma-70 factor, ECF subfamily
MPGREQTMRDESSAERESSWEEYVREIQRRNADALSRLYDASSPMLYRLVYRILRNDADAEEVLLDTFEQVWRTADTFNPVRGGVRPWLILLTRSRALDRLRSMAGRRLREHPGAFERDVSSNEPLPEEMSALNQQQYRLRKAVATLPHEQRQALELAYFSGLTHTEIASTLDVPLGTIKSRIRSAMDKLRLAFTSVAAGDSAR